MGTQVLNVGVSQQTGLMYEGQAAIAVGSKDHGDHLTMGTGADLGGLAMTPLLIIGGVKTYPNQMDIIAADDAWPGIFIAFNESGSITADIFEAYMEALIRERDVRLFFPLCE